MKIFSFVRYRNYNLCKIHTPLIVTIHILVYASDIIKVFKNYIL